MYSSNSELSHQRSKSCYSNRNQRPQYCHSSHRKFADRYNIDSDDSCTRLGNAGNQKVEILEENVVNIDLPPLLWCGYNRTPKILSACNTGRTVSINGQWAGGRPYISGGPLSGSYIFSQIHFHSPSEHEIDGKRYPLEMHVVHYKSSYLTQERAMKEKDGTIVLVYLFQVVECESTVLSQICKFASSLEIRNSRKELNKISLDQFMKPFNSNYYTYRSSVPMDKSSYLLQWIISCNNLSVTEKEVEELSLIMSSCDSTSHSTAMEREDDVIFRVGEEDYCDWTLNSQMTDDPCRHKKVQSNTSVSENQSDASVCEKPRKKSSRKKSPKKSREKSPKKSREKSSKKSREKSPKKSREKSPKKSSREKSPKKSSKKSVREKSSKKSVREKPSKTSASKKSSEKSVSKKSSKTSAKKKSSEKSVSKKSSKSSAKKKSSDKSVCRESSKSSTERKSSDKSVCRESSKSSAERKSSEKCVSKSSSQISVSKKSSSIDHRFSETSSCEKFSKTSVNEKTSESSCGSVEVKGKKAKKRDKRQSVMEDNCENTTPSCSKSDVCEKEKKGKKSKEVCVTKEQSTSKSSEKCSSKGEKMEISEKKSSNCSTKENSGGNKTKKKSTECKSVKGKSKRSSGDLTEKCSEIQASKSVEKVNCSEPNLKADKKSCEKIKTLYEKEKKTAPCPPPRATKAVEIKDECVQSPKPSFNDQCSNTIEINECVQTEENNENDDECVSEDVQVNYLFMSETPSSIHSNIEKVESVLTDSKIKVDLRERGNAMCTKDIIKLPSNSIVNHAIVKAENFPLIKSERTNEFYLHTKHVFRKKGSNSEFTPHAFQECHILIERDRDVLQEYNGTFYPKQLLPGYYEQVNLLTRYSDPEDLKIRATECIAKLESVNELSIRAKFLVSETNLSDQTSETALSHKKSEDSIKNMKSFFDAQCQCEQPKSLSKAINTNFLEEEVDSSPCKSMIKWDLRSMEVENLGFRNTKLVKVQNVGVGRELEARKGNEGKKLKKVSVEQNGGIKILKNADTVVTGSETSSKESLEQKDEGEVDKTINDNSQTNSSEKKKKATYFVYDRIEKDDNTGKKIFVGRFRSRDEFEVLFRKKNTFQSSRMSSDLSEMQSCSHQNLITGNETQENVWEKFRVEDSPALKIMASKEGNPDKKSEAKSPEVITLHKFEPKHSRLKSAKKDSKNLIVGKISNKIDADSEKFSQLAEMLGVDKNRYPKISFYEFQEADVPNLNDFCSDDNSKFDVITLNGVENFGKIDKGKIFPSTSNRSDEEFSEDLEYSSSSEKKAKSSRGKNSQPAVVVVPLEMDSLSKVEFLLIENGNDVKKQKIENKYTSYLKHYKRLILKLQVFVSVVVRGSSKNEVECRSLKSLGGFIFFGKFCNLGR